MTQTCTFCKKTEPEVAFYTNWKCYYCKTCWAAYSARYRKNHKEKQLETNRKSWHKNKHIWNYDSVWERMFAEQNGKCKICGKEQPNKKLATDHCHTTGKIRGLLCDPCNRGIGLLQDSSTILQKAKEYLDEAT